MSNETPQHYSYDYKLDIEKLPASQRDRLPKKILWPGFFCGGMFLLLGIFEVMTYFFHDAKDDYQFALPERFSLNDIVIQRYVFDGFVLLFGILIITLVILASRRYKDIFFVWHYADTCGKTSELFGCFVARGILPIGTD